MNLHSYAFVEALRWFGFSQREFTVVNSIARAVMLREFIRGLFYNHPKCILVLPNSISYKNADMLVLHVRHVVPADVDVPGCDNENETAKNSRRFLTPGADSPTVVKYLFHADASTFRMFSLSAHLPASESEIQSDDMTCEVRAMVLIVGMKPAPANPRNMNSDKPIQVVRAR